MQKKTTIATYNDAPFLIATNDYSAGRRLVIHQFPGVEKPFIEDLGKNLRKFTIQGYVIEDDFTNRDTLINALERPGAGLLSHPYYGDLVVVCESFVVQSDTKQGRVSFFNINFVENGDRVFQSVKIDAVSLMQETKTKALSASKDNFTEKFSNSSNKSSSIVSNVKATLTKITGSISVVRKAVRDTTEFSRQLLEAQRTLQNTNDPLIIAGTILDLMSYGTAIDGVQEILLTAENARQLYIEFTKLFDLVPDKIMSEKDDSSLLTDLVQQAATICAYAVMPLVTYNSFEEADALRFRLTEKTEYFLNAMSDDAIARLSDLKDIMIFDYNNRSLTLPRLSNYRTPTIMPAVVLSYILYGTVTKENDILLLNSIKHPGALPTNTDLKVLTNG